MKTEKKDRNRKRYCRLKMRQKQGYQRGRRDYEFYKKYQGCDLDALDATQTLIIRQYYIEKKTLRAIAADLEVSRETVRLWKKKALSVLEKTIAPDN